MLVSTFQGRTGGSMAGYLRRKLLILLLSWLGDRFGRDCATDYEAYEKGNFSHILRVL